MLLLGMNIGFAGQSEDTQNIAVYPFTFSPKTFTTGATTLTWFQRMRGRIIGFINPNYQGF